MLRGLGHSLRLLYVAYVLARNDALFLLEELRIAPSLVAFLKPLTFHFGRKKRPGERMAKAFSELGPAFIKLGQALSTRSDLFGEEITADLAILQDRMAPFSSKAARKIIEKELGKPLEKLFKKFDDKPYAAASISQVHKATGHDGKKQAVKVLRPNIEKDFAEDIEFLYWLAKQAEKRLPERLKPVEVVRTLEKTVHTEMDMRLEAAAASELKENFPKGSGLIVPKIDWHKTSRRVLTSSWISGININDKEALIEAGFDMNEVLKRASTIVFQQVLRDGFFHADMHPGNLFITKKGDIAAVDFGIMGRLDKKTRFYLAEMLYGFVKRDYMRVAKVHFDAGYVPANQSMDLFAQACRSIGEPILGLPQNEISVAKLLGQLFKISEDFQMELQPQLLLLQKTMMLTEGIGRKLNPNVNMWKLAEPLIEEWATENMNAGTKIKAEVEGLLQQAKRFMKAIEKLPELITEQGIRLHPDTLALLRQKTKKRSAAMLLLVGFASSLSTIAILVLLQILGS